MYFLFYHINKIGFDEWTLYVHISYFLLDIFSTNFMSMLVSAWLIIFNFMFSGGRAVFIIIGRNIPLTSQSTYKPSNSGISNNSKWISAGSSDTDHLLYALIMRPLLQMEHRHDLVCLFMVYRPSLGYINGVHLSPALIAAFYLLALLSWFVVFCHPLI